MTSIRAASAAASGSVGFAIGGDHALVGPPGAFNVHVLVDREQITDSAELLVGEKVGPRVQGLAGGVERVLRAAAVAMDGLLDSASALAQRVAGQAHVVEGSLTVTVSGVLFGGGGLEPVNPS